MRVFCLNPSLDPFSFRMKAQFLMEAPKIPHSLDPQDLTSSHCPPGQLQGSHRSPPPLSLVVAQPARLPVPALSVLIPGSRVALSSLPYSC